MGSEGPPNRSLSTGIRGETSPAGGLVMQLPPEQTERFCRIWLALLHDVNDQLHLVPAFPVSEERNGLLPLSDEMRLRTALWADDRLRERFITTNPAGLSSADLAVVASWQYRRAGSFYLVRALTKYTIFLSEDRSAEHTSVLQSHSDLVFRLLLDNSK